MTAETTLAESIANVQGQLAELQRRIEQDERRLVKLQARLKHLLTVQKCGS